MTDPIEGLQTIAPKLDELSQDVNARVHYELMSDGLVWTDEHPSWDQLEMNEVNCLRGLWRFRTSLIVGNPDEKLRPFWEEAQKRFPRWPGFLPARQQGVWRELFVAQRVKRTAEWENLDTRCRGPEATDNQQVAAQTTQP